MGKLKRHFTAAQEAPKQIACLGNVAEAATLAMVYGQPQRAMHAALWEAIHVGLVFREEASSISGMIARRRRPYSRVS